MFGWVWEPRDGVEGGKDEGRGLHGPGLLWRVGTADAL